MQIISPEQIPLCKDVTDEDVEPIFRQMERICYKYDGVGLHAAQVGIPLNLFIISSSIYIADIAYRLLPPFLYFTNCKYEGWGPVIEKEEGCLSLNYGRDAFLVKRHSFVDIDGTLIGPRGRHHFIQSYNGILARVFAHEIDHGKGQKLLINKIGVPLG